MTEADDRRVQFDFEVDFVNGGGIQGHKRASRAGAAASGTGGATRIDLGHAGDDLAALSLDRLAELDAVRVDVTGAECRAVDLPLFVRYDVAGKAVLVRTGWERRDRSLESHPFLTERAARHLADEGAALVGIDGPSIDATAGGAPPVRAYATVASEPPAAD